MSGLGKIRLMCRGHYASISAASFNSFALKEEIMKAISDCGFEHPSEGGKIGTSGYLMFSAGAVHSQGNLQGRYSLPGPLGNGKDVRVCHLRSSQHSALLERSAFCLLRSFVDQLRSILPYSRDGRSSDQAVLQPRKVPS